MEETKQMVLFKKLPKDTCREKALSSAYAKFERGHWDSWDIKSTLYKRLLNWNKVFKKYKVVTDKILFFEIGLFGTPNSTCFNIGFWQGSFVWKWEMLRL